MKSTVARHVRWTVKEYFRLSADGLLGDRRVELLNGELIEMPAQATPHRASVSRTAPLLFQAFGPGNWVVVQGTLTLSRHYAPEPDFHVFDVPVGTPDNRLPTPLLVIEVSDSTYLKDSGPKLCAYARAGIPDYWIFNIPQDRIEIYRQPENPSRTSRGWKYASVDFRIRGQNVSPLLRPQHSFAVKDLLP